MGARQSRAEARLDALRHPERVSHLVLESASPGLAEPEGRAARVASDEALARDLAKFPQVCMNLDRASVHRQWDLPFEHAMRAEFAHGVAAVEAEGQSGAARFAAGAGRSGSFSD